MKTQRAKDTMQPSMHVQGILVTLDKWQYRPFVQVGEIYGSEHKLCTPNSPLANKAGLDNPKHWAHAVYQTLSRLCELHQQEMHPNPHQ